MDENKLSNTGFTRIKAVCHRFGFSPATVWRKSKNGTFPKSHKLSEAITAWKNSELAEFEENPMNYKSKC